MIAELDHKRRGSLSLYLTKVRTACNLSGSTRHDPGMVIPVMMRARLHAAKSKEKTRETFRARSTAVPSSPHAHATTFARHVCAGRFGKLAGGR